MRHLRGPSALLSDIVGGTGAVVRDRRWSILGKLNTEGEVTPDERFLPGPGWRPSSKVRKLTSLAWKSVGSNAQIICCFPTTKINYNTMYSVPTLC